MTLKKTLFMALVLALVLGFIYAVEIPEEHRHAESEKFFSAAPFEMLDQIRMKSAKGEFVLENTRPARAPGEKSEQPDSQSARLEQAKNWRIQGIPDSRIDKFAFSTLIGALSELKATSVIAAQDLSTDVSVYGLGTPEAEVTTLSGQQKIDVAFGKKNEYVGQRYGRVQSGSQPATIGLFSEALYAAAVKTSDEFRERSPIDFVDNQIARFAVSTPQEAVTIEQEAPGNWKLRSPVEAQAQASVVGSFFRDLRALKADQFIDAAQPLEFYRLSNPDARIRIEFAESANREPIELLVSVGPVEGEKETAHFVIVGRPTVYKLAQNPLPAMMKSADLFRERKLFTFATEKAVRVSSDVGGKKLELQKKDMQWRIGDAETDPTFVRQYLRDLSSAEAAAFPKDVKDFGFSNPFARIEVELQAAPGASETQTRTLIIGAPTTVEGGEAAFFAGVDDLKVPFILVESVVKRLTPDAESLKPVPPTPQAAEGQIDPPQN